MEKNTLLLIARHGNTFGPGDVVKRVGITDLPLVESGLQQGKRLGEYLQQNNLVPDIIFTSQLKRAQQTADQVQKVLNSKLPIESLAIFNEIDYGPDENQPENQVVARLGAEALKEWEVNAKVPHGWKVDPQEVIKNWQDFSNNITRNYVGKKILVVTSNGIARFAPYLTGNFLDFTKKFRIKIATGALCIFEKNPANQNWDCLGWNVTQP